MLKQRRSPALGWLLRCSQTSGTHRGASEPHSRGGHPSQTSQSSTSTRRDQSPAFSPKSQPQTTGPGRYWSRTKKKKGQKEGVRWESHTHSPGLFPSGAATALDTLFHYPELAEGTRPSSPEFQTVTHLPHEFAFPVHTQVEFRLLALDPDLTTEGVCLH